MRDRVGPGRLVLHLPLFVSSEVGPEGQETAEITDFQRVRFCKVVAAAPPPGAAR